MGSWQWLVMGLPGLTLIGLGSPSQAEDILVEFKTGGEAAKVPEARAEVGAVGKTAADDPSNRRGPAQRPELDFSPPAVGSTPLLEGSKERGENRLTPFAAALQGAALPVLTVPAAAASTPTGNAPTSSSFSLPADLTDLFAGEAESLVARAIGSAEGTRTPEGARTSAYYGHVDPGNYRWNQGTFSYQQEAQSPEDADQKQLTRLREQALELHRLAAKWGIMLNLEEALNGIDLANQAPLAALDRGYIDWLVTAKKMGLQGAEAIVWARTRSFIDPDTWRWNAPGLGNSIHTITHDQSRRQQAIAAAIAATPGPIFPSSAALPEAADTATTPPSFEAVDIILELDLPAQLSP